MDSGAIYPKETARPPGALVSEWSITDFIIVDFDKF